MQHIVIFISNKVIEEIAKRERMDNITDSELAGFGVGTLLLCATIAAPKIDAFFAASQRSSLGLCKRCGNLRRIACTRCRGTGSVREGAIFAINLVEDLYDTLGSKSGSRYLA